jgi:hypothetical protein
MNFNKLVAFLSLIFFFPVITQSQKKVNLSDHLQKEKIAAFNRIISLYAKDEGAIEMNAENSDGIGLLEEVEFDTGTIEVELLGENNPGKSFIGMAFNIQEEGHYEVVYFRPFNFVAEEQIRRDHMVQYVYHPEFTWRKLRSERTGEFEDEIKSPPDPDDWFKATIKVMNKKIEVYVNDLPEPVLSVERLSTPKSQKIGVWTGFGSSGRFRNLVIKD